MASSNEVTLNSSYCWEYTNIGLLSEFSDNYNLACFQMLQKQSHRDPKSLVICFTSAFAIASSLVCCNQELRSSSSGRGALAYAADSGHKAIVRLLLDADALPNPSHLACIQLEPLTGWYRVEVVGFTDSSPEAPVRPLFLMGVELYWRLPTYKLPT